MKLQSGESLKVDFVVSALPLTLTARLVDPAGRQEPARFRSVVLVYLLIMALKLQRLEREVDELAARVPDEHAAEALREEARVG